MPFLRKFTYDGQPIYLVWQYSYKLIDRLLIEIFLLRLVSVLQA